MTTSSIPDNLIGWTNSDPENMPLAVTTLRDSVQAALLKRQVNSFKVANAAGLAAISGMVEGDVADRADIDITYRYNGTAWRATSSGMIPIVPSAVSGVGVSHNGRGTITLTASSTASIDGVFSSEFDNYRIVTTLTTVSGNVVMNLRFRVASVDNTSAIHSFGGSYVDSAGNLAYDTGTNGNTQTFIRLGYIYPTKTGWLVDCLGPAIADYTLITMDGINGSTRFTRLASTFSANQFTGISFLPVSGAVTGTIRIYGYNNN